MADRLARKILRNISLFLYLLPLLFATWFCTDVGDYFVNGDSTTGPNLLSVRNRAAQFATFLAYFRTQFTAFHAMTAWTAYLFRRSRVDKVALHMRRLTKVFSTEDPVPTTTANSHFQNNISFLFTVLMVIILGRHSYLIYTIIMSREDFLDGSTVSYFIWNLPKGHLPLLIQLVILLEEISMLVIYRVIISTSGTALDILKGISLKLRSTISTCQRSSLTSMTFSKTALPLLIDLENTAVELIRALDCAFRSVIACGLVGNALSLTSVISQCFLTGSFKALEDYCLFISVITQLILAIVVTLVGFAAIHSKRLQDVRAWNDLLESRQLVRTRAPGKISAAREGEVLLLLTAVFSKRPRSVTVAGVVDITYSLGFKIYMGFLGFICFMIEQQEHHQLRTHYVEEQAARQEYALALACHFNIQALSDK